MTYDRPSDADSDSRAAGAIGIFFPYVVSVFFVFV